MAPIPGLNIDSRFNVVLAGGSKRGRQKQSGDPVSQIPRPVGLALMIGLAVGSAGGRLLQNCIWRSLLFSSIRHIG